MPILDKTEVSMTEMYEGFKRSSVVDGERGSTQLSVAEVLMEPGSAPPLHAHPTEEAILIADGDWKRTLATRPIRSQRVSSYSPLRASSTASRTSPASRR